MSSTLTQCILVGVTDLPCAQHLRSIFQLGTRICHELNIYTVHFSWVTDWPCAQHLHSTFQLGSRICHELNTYMVHFSWGHGFAMSSTLTWYILVGVTDSPSAQHLHSTFQLASRIFLSFLASQLATSFSLHLHYTDFHAFQLASQLATSYMIKRRLLNFYMMKRCFLNFYMMQLDFN